MPAHNGTDTPTDIQVGPPPPSNAALLMSLAVSAAGATLSLIGCLGGMSAPLVVAGYVITLAGLAGAYYVSSRRPRRWSRPSRSRRVCRSSGR